MDYYKDKHRKIIEGLQIFYDNECYGVDAQHDELHAGPDSDLPQEVEKKLKSLGWIKCEFGWSIFT